MAIKDKPRIFWFGMHKVLTRTELPRLRKLGYEVFNPPYVSDIYDQSANLDQDWGQPTTLPEGVFRRLMTHNFFYTAIPQDIAEILSTYFNAVIVTINPDWLKAILDVYSGHVLFRVYGQPYSMSEALIARRMWASIIERDNFHIVPFAAETTEREQQWFTDRCSAIVPYQLPDDVFEYQDTWRGNGGRSSEIVVNIPNIAHPYYREVYDRFRTTYTHSFFRIYGVQRDTPSDRRIVGTLDRRDFLARLRESAGLFYPYTDSVCYLPPIEMMHIGAPVLHMPGSLLAQFYGHRNPGRCEDGLELEKKLGYLLRSERPFIEEAIAAQAPVRERYHPDFVNPIFDAAFTRLLPARSGATRKDCLAQPRLENPRPTMLANKAAGPHAKTVIFPLHHNGLFQHSGGKVFAYEGIPRVVDSLISAIASGTENHVIVSCWAASAHVLGDFFAAQITAARLSLYVLDYDQIGNTTHRPQSDTPPYAEIAKLVFQAQGSNDAARHADSFVAAALRLQFASFINTLAGDVTVVVPHYYLFPECLAITHQVILYLPDYFPHLFPGVVFDTSAEKDAENKSIGVALARKARAIMMNSSYTKNYLASAGFVREGEEDKVKVVPLPFLGETRSANIADEDVHRLTSTIGGRPFLFYPTANRPNKQIALLLEVFARLRDTQPNLKLVLTCSLESYPQAGLAARRLNLMSHILLLPGVSEGGLRWLYERCACLCVTSTMEGNFPPQVIEALNYGAPVVATRLPTITEILGAASERLLLCDALDVQQFSTKIGVAMTDRVEVLREQEFVLRQLRSWNSGEHFRAEIRELISH